MRSCASSAHRPSRADPRCGPDPAITPDARQRARSCSAPPRGVFGRERGGGRLSGGGQRSPATACHARIDVRARVAIKATGFLIVGVPFSRSPRRRGQDCAAPSRRYASLSPGPLSWSRAILRLASRSAGPGSDRASAWMSSAMHSPRSCIPKAPNPRVVTAVGESVR